MNFSFQSTDTADTLCLAARIGQDLAEGAVVFLHGEMGAGKTLFARGLYEGLEGRDQDQVMSPTYTLVNMYDQARLPISHADLYRLINQEQLMEMEFEDILWNPDGVCIIEWPELAEGLVPSLEVLQITLDVGENRDQRTITVHSEGDKYSRVFQALELQS